MLLPLTVSIASLFVSAGGIPMDQETFDTANVTCQDWLNSTSEEAFDAWIYGYAMGKAGKTVVKRALLFGNIISYTADACSANPQARLLDVISAPGFLNAS